MKRYEGLFILNGGGREEGVKEMIDTISDEITKASGKVETVQKMDKRHFSRVADKKATSGFYTNVIFECDPGQMTELRRKLMANKEVFRVLVTAAAPASAEQAAVS